MRSGLTERWYREGAAPAALTPLACLYGALMRARRRAYASGWLPVLRSGAPVVVVGNLTVGGTGKTPLTIWLARELAAAGLRVGIVTRGYGARAAGPLLVDVAADWREVGDEALLLARHSGCTTMIARDRVAGARALVAGGAEVVLADDGLQHLRLARNCEIVVIDGARGVGNGRVLPAGPLREPLAGLPPPDLVVINGAAEHASLARLAPLPATYAMRLVAGAALRLDGAGGERALEEFRGRRVHAVAGIGNPARFFRELRARGIETIEHAFPDHHPYRAAELAFGDQLPVLMTEKDAVRCTAFADARLWYVPAAAQLEERAASGLLAQVRAALRAAPEVGSDG